MTDSKLLISRDRPYVLQLTLNRREVHNAFDRDMIEQLTASLVQAADDPGIRVVTLRAAGPSFSAGGDLAWMRRASEAPKGENRADAQKLGDMFLLLAQLPKPTVALVQGNAFGGGVGIAAACDVVIAVRAARFALTEVKLGIAPAVISPHIVAAIGPRMARRYMLTAESFGADEAQRIGLVHDVVASAAELEGAGIDLVNRILANGPEAVARTKALIRSVTGRPLDAALVSETADLIAEMRTLPEGREGLSAFLEKRKPNWAG